MATSGLIKMRLRLVEEVSFCQSEATNFRALPASKRRLLKAPTDVICFVSRTHKQMVFVYAPHDGCLTSVRLRLVGWEVWEPTMLKNYARRVGLDLDGLPLFEESYERIMSRRKRGAAA